jgi:hypothetical protein
MKIFIGMLLTILCGALLWQGLRVGMVIRSCNGIYQDELTTGHIQETTTGNHSRYCNMSYDTITSWEECVTGTKNIAPVFLTKYARPLVIRAFHVMGDVSSSLHEIKLEHDDYCKDEIDYMFYPPEQEK